MPLGQGKASLCAARARGSRVINATLDLTRTTNENRRHWQHSDTLSGRSAYPRSERKVARERSRMEAENNSWYAGMLRTAANHIVGTGPRLQVMIAGKPLVNAKLEKAWRKWALEIGLAEKLRIALETYWRDGECFAMRTCRGDGSEIDLDFRLYEGDQVSQPFQPVRDPSVEDGKRVNAAGTAIEYYILDYHPGDWNLGFVNFLAGNWYPAAEVWHLFRADRPGMLRGLPRCAPGIDWLAHMRRFSKATLSAAEQAANWGMFAKTTGTALPPVNMGDGYAVDWIRNALNFLPDGWDLAMVDPKHPATTNEMFQRTELMYFCRCANMPYSLACGTSKDANFSAAKMDIINLWQPEVKSEQDKLSSTVMASLFRWFLEECVYVPGLLDGVPEFDQVEYRFDWPPLPVADEIDNANAASIRVSNGLTTLREEYMSRGKDFDAAMTTGAADYGVTVDEYKRAIFARHFAVTGMPGGVSQLPSSSPPPATPGGGVKQQAADILVRFKSGGASAPATKSALLALGLTEANAIAAMEVAQADRGIAA